MRQPFRAAVRQDAPRSSTTYPGNRFRVLPLKWIISPYFSSWSHLRSQDHRRNVPAEGKLSRPLAAPSEDPLRHAASWVVPQGRAVAGDLRLAFFRDIPPSREGRMGWHRERKEKGHNPEGRCCPKVKDGELCEGKWWRMRVLPEEGVMGYVLSCLTATVGLQNAEVDVVLAGHEHGWQRVGGANQAPAPPSIARLSSRRSPLQLGISTHRARLFCPYRAHRGSIWQPQVHSADTVS